MHKLNGSRPLTHCEKCDKLLPGQPIWMVIPRGEEWKYLCFCGLWVRYPYRQIRW